MLVSYHKQKLRLRWGTGAVTVNPELKLLQYDIGKPVVAEETVDYMLEKSGMIFVQWNSNIRKSMYVRLICRKFLTVGSFFPFWEANWSSFDTNVCSFHVGSDAILVQLLVGIRCDSWSRGSFSDQYADLSYYVYWFKKRYSSSCLCESKFFY